MFSYYGSKSKISVLYQPPQYQAIIEPFAGAAYYSFEHFRKSVILNEKYCVISSLWKWLVNKATSDEILAHRDFMSGEDISSLNLRKEHKDLIGFCINRGSTSPRNIVQKWSCQVKSKPLWASTPYYRLTQIANNLSKIKHWSVICGDYTKIDNIEATWFIDPPYQFGGEHYVVNDINYDELALWCQSRKGQVIVCENSKANWLPFQPLITINGQKHKTNEVVWCNK